MPLFITQGRYTREAIAGMMATPEDREAAVRELFAQSGGTLLAYYMTFGESDFMVISEGPMEGVATSLIVAAASGGVTDVRTTLAITTKEMQQAFSKAAAVAGRFKAAGGHRKA